jgi:hypothetical protein
VDQGEGEVRQVLEQQEHQGKVLQVEMALLVKLLVAAEGLALWATMEQRVLGQRLQQ